MQKLLLVQVINSESLLILTNFESIHNIVDDSFVDQMKLPVESRAGL